MSKKNKNDGVYTNFYADFLKGGQPRYRANGNGEMKMLIERMYYRVLTELSLNRFKWHNLPKSVDERFLELGLMRHGAMLFFNHETDTTGSRYLVQQFAGEGWVNHYDNPTRFRTVSHVNIVNKVYNAREAVPIWGNYLRQPDGDIVRVYCHRLTELDTTIDVNTLNARHPKILAFGEESKLTMEIIDQQTQAGIPVIKTNSMANMPENLAAFDAGVHHETIPAMLAAKGKMWNDALMMLGVPTANQDKKERMITGEVDAGKDQSEVIRNIALNSREIACEQINEMFGLNIEVEWRQDDEQLQAASQSANALGIPTDSNDENGEDHGTIHPNSE